jgi:hypothetical protein
MTAIEQLSVEILDLHAFLQAWFNGTPPKTQHAFSRISTAWGADFQLCTINGRTLDGSTVLSETFAAHGAYSDLRIVVKHLAIEVSEETNLATASFEEWHEFRDSKSGRLCKALFTHLQGAQRPPKWVRVEESRLKASQSEA